MNALVWLAVALGILWLVAVAAFKIVGFAVHLALIASVVLLAVWAVRKVIGVRSRA
jgi:hypothetical protein